MALITVVQVVPGTIGYYAEGAPAATGAVTWFLGAVLVAAALRGLLRAAPAIEVVGMVALLGGAALTYDQWGQVAPLLGVATAVVLLGLGMLPGQSLVSLGGAAGLLVNVPWAIARLFPGETRVPLLILVSGILLLAVALLLSRIMRRGGPRTPHLGGHALA